MKVRHQLQIASWVMFAAWMGGIFYASSLTGPELAPIIPIVHWDKLCHAIAYCIGAMILALALRETTDWPWGKVTLMTVAVLSLYGATDEWHQLYTPNRSGGDAADLVADIIGALAGVKLFRVLYVRFRKN